MNSGERVVVRSGGGVVVITQLQPGDAGQYQCVVNNTAGSITLTTRVMVTTPLSVQVRDSINPLIDPLKPISTLYSRRNSIV